MAAALPTLCERWRTAISAVEEATQEGVTSATTTEEYAREAFKAVRTAEEVTSELKAKVGETKKMLDDGDNTLKEVTEDVRRMTQMHKNATGSKYVKDVSRLAAGAMSKTIDKG